MKFEEVKLRISLYNSIKAMLARKRLNDDTVIRKPTKMLGIIVHDHELREITTKNT